MNNVVEFKPPPPKRVHHTFEGQKIILQFNPNALAENRWEWVVTHTVSFQYQGANTTEEKALSRAKAKIRELKGVRDAG